MTISSKIKRIQLVFEQPLGVVPVPAIYTRILRCLMAKKLSRFMVPHLWIQQQQILEHCNLCWGKNLHRNGLMQFKPMLFKSQLYLNNKEVPIYLLTIISRKQNDRTHFEQSKTFLKFPLLDSLIFFDISTR